MSIKTLTPIQFGQNQPYVFDTDTKTLPELCALLHGKVNETVEEFNKLDTEIREGMETFIQEAKEEMQHHDSSLRQEFQDFIDTIDLKLRALENRIKAMEV